MSETILKLISVDETYIPGAAGQAEAQDVLATYLPQASRVQVCTSKHIEFVDAGANFESISCPHCGTQLEVEWWQDAMDRAAETRFENLTVLTPCCETKLSLNDLVYQFPGGFARFVLSADNPQADLKAGQLEVLAKILGCQLRRIWAHY